jgi:FkbM family methyltransferase
MILEVVSKVKNKILPSEHYQMVKRWCSDGGDYELRFNYDLSPDSIVLDFGGFEGQWASDLFARYQCCICVFEPVKRFAQEITARFSKNEHIEVFPYGLGGSSRTEKIYISGNGSSVFGASIDQEEIQIVDAKDWIQERGLGEIALAKLNIEGGEYELLERLIETGLIKNIKDIQVQFHDVADDSRSRMAKIQQELSKTHQPTYQYEFVWENWTRKA